MLTRSSCRDTRMTDWHDFRTECKNSWHLWRLGRKSVELICGVFSGLGGRWLRTAGPGGAGGSGLTAMPTLCCRSNQENSSAGKQPNQHKPGSRLTSCCLLLPWLYFYLLSFCFTLSEGANTPTVGRLWAQTNRVSRINESYVTESKLLCRTDV